MEGKRERDERQTRSEEMGEQEEREERLAAGRTEQRV